MIIKSLLDSDLYKFTMQQVCIHFYPNLKVRYKLTIRDKRIFPEKFVEKLSHEIVKMSELFLTSNEEHFLSTKLNHVFTQPYIQYLKAYTFDPNEVSAKMVDDNLELFIEGYLHKTILWEVPLMAMISELFFKETGQMVDISSYDIEFNDKTKIKAFENNDVTFTEFGTRRRYSYDNQDRIIRLFKNSPSFKGTSNVHFAMKYDLNCVGTMAHEWIMINASVHGFQKGNELALKHWSDFYKGLLGIALTDTFTTDVFLRVMDKATANLYDGVRHDSGCPKQFTDKVVNKYRELGIDPLTKSIVFSDNLNTEKAIDIVNYTKNKISIKPFGIGTFMTNDVGVKPMNMVIKVSHVLIENEWVGTVKLSDDKMKNTGNSDDIDHCKKSLRLI